MTGTELKIITPAATEVLGPDVDRLATLHTNARTDTELLKVWLKSHRDGSPHTVRVYARVGGRFLAALGAAGTELRKATVEDVQAALEAMTRRDRGSGAQGIETVLCPGLAKNEGLLVERSRLGGVSSHITRPPGRQHVWIVGLGEGEGDCALPAGAGACDVAALDALGGLRQ
jgi:hypothetical protein